MSRPAPLAPRSIVGALLVLGALPAIAIAQNAVSGDAGRPAVGTSAAPPAVKQLDPTDLAFWKNIRYTTLSYDGKWFAYQLEPN